MSALLRDNERQIIWPQKQTLVRGKVIDATSNRILVDLGPNGIGIIMGPEVRESVNILGKIKKGDDLSAQVLIPENEEGYVELSVKNAMFQTTWQELERKFANQETVGAEVMEANKGGLIMKFSGIIGFLPVSQLASNNYPRVEGGDKGKIVQELKKLVNKNLTVKIIDLSLQEKRVIFSEKIAGERLQEAIKKYKKGDIIEGEVTGIVDFGMFVKFDENLKGLVHISELAWQIIENMHEAAKVGDKIKAKIIDIMGDKISLSIKALEKDPWIDIEKKYKKDDIIEGTVTKFSYFGSFVAVDKYIHGLCHISEFGSPKKMEDTLQIGQKYKFKILSIDAPEHKIALSLVKEEITPPHPIQ